MQEGAICEPHGVMGGACPLVPFPAAQPDCLLIVYQFTRSHSPYPPRPLVHVSASLLALYGSSVGASS